MTQIINGPGNPLPPPQFLYPSELNNAPLDLGTNYITLSAGDTTTIPAGRYWTGLGSVAVLQYLDPVTGIWRGADPIHGAAQVVFSDGFTRRVANLTGCPIAAVVAGGGTSFTQSTAVVTASTGSSTWQPIVGGSLSIVSITGAGKNFTMPPIVVIPAPPLATSPNAPVTGSTTAPLGGYGGVQAAAYATLTNNTVSSVSLTNFGAGYPSAPIITVIPNPSDPNYATITNATVTCGVVNSGVITAVLCTNSGGPLATISALTLTASGGSGSGATITPVIMQTVTATSVVSGGVGLGSATEPAKIMSVAGIPASVSAITNPALELTGFRPRSFDGAGTCNSGGTITSVTIYDNGLFVGTPTAAIAPGAASVSAITLASITFTMGSITDTVLLQPL